MILVIDNYDSFVYNLVQYLGELGADPIVHRCDALTIDDVLSRRMRLAPELPDRGVSVAPRVAGRGAAPGLPAALLAQFLPWVVGAGLALSFTGLISSFLALPVSYILIGMTTHL